MDGTLAIYLLEQRELSSSKSIHYEIYTKRMRERKDGDSRDTEISALEAGEKLCMGEQHSSALSTAGLFGLNESQITLKCIEKAQFKSGCVWGKE